MASKTAPKRSSDKVQDGAAIYRALVTQAKGRVKGAKLVKKQNPSAGDYAALMIGKQHVAYLHQLKGGARVELRVNGNRVARKVGSESDIPAAVDAIESKASEVTATKEAK